MLQSASVSDSQLPAIGESRINPRQIMAAALHCFLISNLFDSMLKIGKSGLDVNRVRLYSATFARPTGYRCTVNRFDR